MFEPSSRGSETSSHRAIRASLLRWLSSAGAWVKDLLARLARARTLGVAAETAFWLFLSLVPLAAVAGLVTARSSASSSAHVEPLLRSLPTATQALISAELSNLAAQGEGSVGVGSAVVFVWLASSGVHSIFDSLEIQAGTSRPWWHKRLLALGTCVALSFVVAVLAVLGPGLEGAMGWLGEWIPPLRRIGAPTTIGRVIRFVASAGVVFAYVSALYRVGIPRSARRRARFAPGALVAVALEILLGLAYAFYLAKAGDGGAYMAGLAVVGVTMMGLYLFTVAILIGAVVNRKLDEDAQAPRGGP